MKTLLSYKNEAALRRARKHLVSKFPLRVSCLFCRGELTLSSRPPYIKHKDQ